MTITPLEVCSHLNTRARDNRGRKSSSKRGAYHFPPIIGHWLRCSSGEDGVYIALRAHDVERLGKPIRAPGSWKRNSSSRVGWPTVPYSIFFNKLDAVEAMARCIASAAASVCARAFAVKLIDELRPRIRG